MPAKSCRSQLGTPIGISKLASIRWCLNKCFSLSSSSTKGILATAVMASGTVQGLGGLDWATGQIRFSKSFFWSFEDMVITLAEVGGNGILWCEVDDGRKDERQQIV